MSFESKPFSYSLSLMELRLGLMVVYEEHYLGVLMVKMWYGRACKKLYDQISCMH